MPPWSEFVDAYWGDHCQMYITPVTPQSVCVACISSDPHLRLENALPLFPALARRLQGAEPLSREQGRLTLSRRLPQVCHGDVALIGDASGSLDAITGEGLALGFEQALALRDALGRGDLHRYQIAHRRLSLWPMRMARLLLAMNGHPRFRRRVMHTLAADPRLFSHLLDVHTGMAQLRDPDFGAGAFVWNFLAARERPRAQGA
jgi:flavin-dependent dehydrogenase